MHFWLDELDAVCNSLKMSYELESVRVVGLFLRQDFGATNVSIFEYDATCTFMESN